jgi:polyadenylate-binding protein
MTLMTPKKNGASKTRGVLGVFYARNNIFGPNCTVFLDNLGPNVAEAALFKTFNQIGVISSARVVRDPRTGKSLGQAYLNFVNPVDANRALVTMNGKLIDGRSVRIRRKRWETYLCVKNIPEEVSKQQLRQRFEEFGKITSCRIMEEWKSKNSGHKGYGYIRFHDQRGADRAVDEANSKEGLVMHGKRIDVQYYLSWKERSHQMIMNEHTYTCIHIKGYPSSWVKEDVESLFKTDRVKEPIEIDFATKEDGTSKKYSYISFDDHESAVESLKELQGRRIDNDHALVVQRLMSNFERQQVARKEWMDQKKLTHRKYKGRNLYVKNFPMDWDQNQLHDLFSKYGKVTSAKVMKDGKDESRGFGFVCFESEKSADTALSALNNFPIEDKILVVNHAELKQARKERLWGSGNKSEGSSHRSPRYKSPKASFSPRRGRGRSYRGNPWVRGRGPKYEIYERSHDFQLPTDADFRMFGYQGY